MNYDQAFQALRALAKFYENKEQADMNEKKLNVDALTEMLTKLADGYVVIAPFLPHPIAMTEEGTVGYYFNKNSIMGNLTVGEALDIANQIKNTPEASYTKVRGEEK